MFSWGPVGIAVHNPIGMVGVLRYRHGVNVAHDEGAPNVLRGFRARHRPNIRLRQRFQLLHRSCSALRTLHFTIAYPQGFQPEPPLPSDT